MSAFWSLLLAGVLDSKARSGCCSFRPLAWWELVPAFTDSREPWQKLMDLWIPSCLAYIGIHWHISCRIHCMRRSVISLTHPKQKPWKRLRSVTFWKEAYLANGDRRAWALVDWPLHGWLNWNHHRRCMRSCCRWQLDLQARQTVTAGQ